MSKVKHLLFLLWITSFLGGYLYLVDYHFQEAPQRLVKEKNWPEQELELDPSSPTLVLAVHPQCSCTRATTAELRRILGASQKNVRIYALVYCPEKHTQNKSWTDSFTMQSLHYLPHIQFVEDVKGEKAQVFQMQTSGHVQLYSPEGKLLFNGGVTSARAHEGENRATEKILSLLKGEGEKGEVAQHPVFGCPLYTDSSNTNGI